MGLTRTPTENKRIARQYFAHILNEGDFSDADTLLASDFIFRNPPVVARGVEDFKRVIEGVRTAFPDLRFTVQDELAEADKVAVRWIVTGTQRGDFFGHPASGKTIEVTGMNIFRIAGGRIQEIWVNMDRFGEAQQLGWIGSVIG
jgi:steroid delta-isomerase-like uncharacterized protein